MNRRKFLNNSIKACTATLLAEQLMGRQQLYAKTALMNALAETCTDNVLVLVQLFGGNDGLNTFIPLDQYSTLNSVRQNVTIPEASLKFATSVNNGTATLGSRSTVSTKYADMAFHPAMEGVYDLFESNRLSMVMGCSYDKPDYSHFRGTDIWMMGADSNEFLKSGWVGRNLEELYKEYGFPDPAELFKAGFQDPLCINMGSIAPLAFNASTGVGAGVAVTSISNNYPLLGGFGDLAPASCAGEELTFLRKVAIDTDKYNERIVSAGNAQKTNMSTLYGTDALSNQLKNVARLIKGGLKTRVYMVNLGGFDTHTQQVGNNTYDGNHTSLLWSVSKAIAGFQDDIEKMGVADKVMGMVFTEFGRTVRSNGGKGTDHGRSTPVWLFGSSLKGGRYGSNPQLTNPTTNQVEAQVPMQYDYRSVYYSVLKDWFGLNATQMDGVFGGPTKVAKYAATYHDLIKDNKKVACTTTATHDQLLGLAGQGLSEAYPNPVEEAAIIGFGSQGGYLNLELFDVNGQSHGVLLEGHLPAGRHEYRFERKHMHSGVYIIKLRNENFQDTKKLILK